MGIINESGVTQEIKVLLDGGSSSHSQEDCCSWCIILEGKKILRIQLQQLLVGLSDDIDITTGKPARYYRLRRME